jgi:hypothetical protein
LSNALLGGLGAGGRVLGLAARFFQVLTPLLGRALLLCELFCALVGRALRARQVGRDAHHGLFGGRHALLRCRGLARLLLNSGAQLVGRALPLRGLGVEARGLAVEVPADGAVGGFFLVWGGCGV